MGTNVYDAPFYKPPTVSTSYPGNIPSGQILLYKDADWGSDSLTIDTTSSAYPEGYPFSFSGTGLDSEATWIAFNLPEGVVCTLFDYSISPPSSSTPFSLAGAGVCVDLIGNGDVQTVDLFAYGANDRMSAGIWRQVDMSAGWFQLFRDTNSEASFVTIFLAEWPVATANSLSGWDINSIASSINYPSLTPPQQLLLWTNTDGSGPAVALGATNPFGTFATPATVNFTDRKMNDKIQSFTYNIIPPVMATIQSVTTDSNLIMLNGGQTVEETINGQNNSSAPVTIATNVFQNQSYSLTNTTTFQYQLAVSLTVTLSMTAGVKDIDSTTGTITSQYTATSSETTTNTITQTQLFQAGQTITFTAPAETAYSATASISFGALPPTTVKTTGSFYYKQNLPGSVLDEASGLYMLNMPIVVTLDGLIGTQVSFQVSGTPIGPLAASVSQAASKVDLLAANRALHQRRGAGAKAKTKAKKKGAR
jgi:hypothetical protein